MTRTRGDEYQPFDIDDLQPWCEVRKAYGSQLQSGHS